MYRTTPSYVVERESNIVRVDFGREPDPPAPKFPGAGALHEAPMSEGAEPALARDYCVVCCHCDCGAGRRSCLARRRRTTLTTNYARIPFKARNQSLGLIPALPR